ncbi:MAG: hypothetical protein KBT11_09405 [Treponema sp.]|nr:hypothetical protein [Candidatus Treponema equifaecale]
MDFITFCACGKPVDETFIYCPWCGKQNRDHDDKDVLENVFSQLEEKQANDRISRVKKIESKIEALEKELGLLSKLSGK